MKKILISSLFLLFNALSVFSQGIEFEHGSWTEVLKKAKEQNKPIFVDVYTTWCGPCKVMVTTVFPRPEVGTKFNKGFINVKIDAEKGEGIAIAKKYEVKAYPTYLFINPSDESLVNRAVGSLGVVELNDLADRILDKFAGKKEISLSELDAKYNSGDFDEAFAQSYIKRLKAERKPSNEALGKYFSKFVTRKSTDDQLYFLALNFERGAVSDLYSYMVNNYKIIDVLLCKNDGLAAASFDRSIVAETVFRINKTINNKQLSIPEKELEFNKLFENFKTVLSDKIKAEKKILEFKIDFYRSNKDTLRQLQVSREYIKRFLLPTDKTASIAREVVILDKNFPTPMSPIDSTGTSNWCSSYAVHFSGLSKDPQDKKLATKLLNKAKAYDNSSYVKVMRNIVLYNFGQKKEAIEQQTFLLSEMKKSNDVYLVDAETTVQKMKNNEAKIPFFSYKMKKH